MASAFGSEAGGARFEHRQEVSTPKPHDLSLQIINPIPPRTRAYSSGMERLLRVPELRMQGGQSLQLLPTTVLTDVLGFPWL